MAEELARKANPGQLTPVLTAGLAIGWLTGLSLSPVVATVLAAVMATVGALVAGLASAGNANAQCLARCFRWGSKLVKKVQDPKTLRSVVECICDESQ